jgi:hypothetical protein
MPRDEPELGGKGRPLVDDADFDGVDEEPEDGETFDPSPKNGVPPVEDDPGSLPRGPRPS